MANEVLIPKNLGEGGSYVLTSEIKRILEAIADDIATLKVAFELAGKKFNQHVGAAGGHKAADNTNLLQQIKIVTSEAEFKEMAEEIITAYEAHRVLLTSHAAADSTNTMTFNDPTCHTNVDNTNLIEAGYADGISSAILLANDIKAKFNAHIADQAVHVAADAVNEITEDDAVDIDTLIALASDIKDCIEAHKQEAPAVHANADDTTVFSLSNVLTLSDAIVTLNEAKIIYTKHLNSISHNACVSLVNTVKAAFNAHLAAAAHDEPDQINTVVAGDATDINSCYSLMNEMLNKYNLHCILIDAHNTFDAANLLPFTEVNTRIRKSL